MLSGEAGEPHLYSAGGGLPDGVEAAFPGREPNDMVLWVPSRRARSSPGIRSWTSATG
jgi:hypothetical protein